MNVISFELRKKNRSIFTKLPFHVDRRTVVVWWIVAFDSILRTHLAFAYWHTKRTNESIISRNQNDKYLPPFVVVAVDRTVIVVLSFDTLFFFKKNKQTINSNKFLSFSLPTWWIHAVILLHKVILRLLMCILIVCWLRIWTHIEYKILFVRLKIDIDSFVCCCCCCCFLW